MKKAQAAMEFLMTYGWAILVVLVAIGALAYFGVLSPDKFLPEKCIISAGSGLFCDKFSIDNTALAEQIQLKISNSLAEDVSVAIGDAEISDGVNSCANAALTTLTSDSSTVIDLDTDGSVGTCAGLTGTSKIKGDISLSYTDADSFTKKTTGTLVSAGG